MILEESRTGVGDSYSVQIPTFAISLAKLSKYSRLCGLVAGSSRRQNQVAQRPLKLFKPKPDLGKGKGVVQIT